MHMARVFSFSVLEYNVNPIQAAYYFSLFQVTEKVETYGEDLTHKEFV